MLAIELTVTHADQTVKTIKVRPVTQVAFERKFGTSIVKAFQDSPAMEHIYWLAWHAARSGVEFDQWLDSVDDINFEADAVDPTQPTPSAT